MLFIISVEVKRGLLAASFRYTCFVVQYERLLNVPQ